jgi:hypothetical protein
MRALLKTAVTPVCQAGISLGSTSSHTLLTEVLETPADPRSTHRLGLSQGRRNTTY